MNPNKTIGSDEIHPRQLKELVDFKAVPIYIVMNNSLVEGHLPDDWKLAYVSPIYKKGAKNLGENYRPVSLTAIICRSLEKIIKHQIMNHLEQENLLSSKQHGFIEKRSTAT